MVLLKRLILFFLLVSCSGGDDEAHILYSFPSLSQGQLIDLKNQSETIEGFFMTTDLSDLDSAWEERGFYLYVCIRFLNDKEVNEKLNKSAIPLLLQVSTHKDKPTAESILLLHPETVKDKKGTFYYEERQHFQFVDSSITIRNIEYNIFDVFFNERGKITNISFLKEGATLEDLANDSSESEEEEEEEDDENDDENENEDEDREETAEDDSEQEKKQDVLLEVKAFAKQFSSSCTDWPILEYKHSEEIPDYLKVNYIEGNSGTTSGTNSGSSSADSTLRELPLIPEDAEHRPVPQN